MAKVMAMPGTRTAVADLCMFGLAACDEGRCGRLSTRDELECGCEVNARAHIDTLGSTRTTQSRRENKQEHGCAKLLKQWRNI